MVLCMGGAMPIRIFLGSDASVGPDDLKVMGEAFSSALSKLGLSAGNDPMVEMVGRRIIRAMLDGERDPVRLFEIGVEGTDPPTAQASDRQTDTKRNEQGGGRGAA
jgi:hypothetical protein